MTDPRRFADCVFCKIHWWWRIKDVPSVDVCPQCAGPLMYATARGWYDQRRVTGRFPFRAANGCTRYGYLMGESR